MIALFYGFTVGFGVWFAARAMAPGGVFDRRNAMQERLAGLIPVAGITASLRKRTSFSDIDALDQALHKHKFAKRIAALLVSAKLKVSVSTFLWGSAILGGVSLFAIGRVAPFPVALAGATLVTAIPFFWLRAMRARYLAKFAEYLPNALSVLSNSIKVGHGIEIAFSTVADVAPWPLNTEFSTVRAEIRLGLSLEAALANLYDRIRSEELKILLTSIAIHQELGGNLSEIVDNLETTIRERFALQREAQALSSQGVMSSWILFCIPIFLSALWFVRDPKTLIGFAQSPGGKVAIGISVFFQLAGFFWIRRIIRLRD